MGPKAEILRAAAPLIDAGVPEKIAARHGEALTGAVGDVAQLAALGGRLKGHHAGQFDRVLEGFYKLLGRQLDAAPEAERSKIVKASLPAVRALAETVGATELLVPAFNAAMGFVDHGLRLEAKGKLTPTPAQLRSSFSEAVSATEDLITRFEGRDGLGAALSSFPVIAEHAERATADLTPDVRKGLWREVADLLGQAPPVGGVDLALVAQLARAVAQAVKGGARGAEAIAEARQSYVANHSAPSPPELRAAVAAAPAGPARAALEALVGQIEAVFAANPTGGGALASPARDLVQGLAARVGSAEGQAAAKNLASVVQGLVGSPAAASGLGFLHRHLETLLGAGAEPLAAASAAPDIASAMQSLLRAVAGAGAAPALERALGGLKGLSGTGAQLAGFAAADAASTAHGPRVLEALIARVASPMNAPHEALPAFAAGLTLAAHALEKHLEQGPEAAALTPLVARAIEGAKEPGPRVEAIGAQLALIRATMPRVPLEPLVEDSGAQIGLTSLTDPGRTRFNPPENFLEPLLREAEPKLGGDKKGQLELTRIAMTLADVMSGIAGDPNPLFKRVREDLASALQDPSRLKGDPGGGGAVALRAAQMAAPTLSSTFERLPELPPELVMTAALHLEPKQQAWVQDFLSKRTGLNEGRQLRDTICACVDAGQLSLIDAMVGSKSSSKALSAVTREVALQFRAGKLAEVDFAALEAGLRAGEDPVANMEGARAAQQLKGLDLVALTEGKLDPAGVEQVMQCQQVIAPMLEQFVEGYQPPMDTEIKYGELRPALLDVLKNVASGHWPAPKYESEVNARIMGRLDPKLRPMWRDNSVTFAKPPAADAEVEAQLEQAMTLLRGLAKTLPEGVRLEVPDMELAWDQASLDALRTRQGELLDTLRGAQKGTKDHRAASRARGPVASAAGVLELQLSLEAALGGEGAASGVVNGLRGALEASQGALRKIAAPGFSRAVDEVLDVARSLKPRKKEGTYAADEDSLPALITSHQSGCLSPAWGARLWGLPGAAADANIKMLRVYRGDKQVWRTFLKFFPVKFEGYEGPAIWVENPKADGGGNGEERTLLYRHAIEKAQQMGLPVMCGCDYDPGYDDLAQVAKGMGLEVKSGTPIKLFFEEGNTPVQHSDGVLSTGQGNNVNRHGRIRDFREDNEFWERDKTMRTIVMPRA